MTDLTAERLRELLEYDPETGRFLWKARRPEDFNETPARTAEMSCRIWNSKHAGNEAGATPKGGGYFCLTIGDRQYAAHRTAWLYVHGSWPSHVIDHKDGNPSNNRISNLRNATTAQNAQSKKRSVSNTSGVKGVYWAAKAQRWAASIKVSNRTVWLGHFEDKSAAAMAYADAARKHYGEFARLA